MNDEQFDQFLAKAAKEYREPPATPRDEIWARIRAARTGDQHATPVVDLRTRRPPIRLWYLGTAALAAAVVLGIAIGRRSVAPVATPAPRAVAVTPDSAATRRAETIMRVAAVDHFSRVEALLTDFEHGTTDPEFQSTAKDLLTRTRLLLDSKRLVDPRLRALLADLELVLVQLAQVPAAGSSEERRLIDDGINERRVRSRLRDAIPAGPTA